VRGRARTFGFRSWCCARDHVAYPRLSLREKSHEKGGVYEENPQQEKQADLSMVGSDGQQSPSPTEGKTMALTEQQITMIVAQTVAMVLANLDTVEAPKSQPKAAKAAKAVPASSKVLPDPDSLPEGTVKTGIKAKDGKNRTSHQWIVKEALDGSHYWGFVK